MNKAFLREGEQSDDDSEAALGAASLPTGTPNYVTPSGRVQRREPRLRPTGTPNYVTPSGHRRLKDELLDLLDVKRPEIVGLVSWAASNGDRSENGDYLYGKKRLREIDRRIRFLTKRLDIAKVIDPCEQQHTDQVFFGAKVCYENDLGEQTRVHIVGVDEADPLNGAVSWVSPVANALRRARVGDIVTVSTPSGQRELEVLSIEY